MNIADKILKLVREKPLPVYELRERLGLSPMKMLGVLKFLVRHELVETIAGDNLVMIMKITPQGLQLLNLPNLPEDETTGEEITELMLIEQKIADKTIDLYTSDQQVESIKGIAGMAKRFNITNSDVIHALWICARSEVWAKLEQDLKAKHQFFAITPPLVSAKKEATKQ